jgi:CheY-like chemotaxis protein
MTDETQSGTAKILVVDDAPQNVKLLRLILKDAGYQVEDASSGPEALAKLHQEKPHVMVLDVRMPGMSGYEVCQEVRKDPEFATLPVIMVTALSLPEERIKGIQAGATDFITKPFIKKELLARIQSCLSLKSLEQGEGLAPLPGATLVLTPDWKILAISSVALAVLGVPRLNLASLDFLTLLRQPGAWISADPTSSTEPWVFCLPPTPGQAAISGRHTPVKDTADRLVLRVIVLNVGET